MLFSNKSELEADLLFLYFEIQKNKTIDSHNN